MQDSRLASEKADVSPLACHGVARAKRGRRQTCRDVAPAKCGITLTKSDFLFLVSSFLFNQNFNKAPNSFNVFHLGIIVAVNCRDVNKTNFNFASCRFN